MERIILDYQDTPTCECGAGQLEFIDKWDYDVGSEIWKCPECKAEYELYPSQWTLIKKDKE